MRALVCHADADVIHLVFDKLSHSKVSDLLHIASLSNSYFEILTVE